MARFGTFTFTREESAVWPTDSGWRSEVETIDLLPPNGAPLMLGAQVQRQTRTFAVLLPRDRLVDLQALIGTTDTFVDWSRPVPETRTAYLAGIQQDDNVQAGLCEEKLTTVVTLIDQS